MFGFTATQSESGVAYADDEGVSAGPRLGEDFDTFTAAEPELK